MKKRLIFNCHFFTLLHHHPHLLPLPYDQSRSWQAPLGVLAPHVCFDCSHICGGLDNLADGKCFRVGGKGVCPGWCCGSDAVPGNFDDFPSVAPHVVVQREAIHRPKQLLRGILVEHVGPHTNH